MSDYIQTDVDISAELRDVVETLARAHPTRVVRIYGPNHAEIMSEYDTVVPGAMKYLQEADAVRIVRAGAADIPRENAPDQAFRHGAAREGRTVGSVEIKTNGEGLA